MKGRKRHILVDTLGLLLVVVVHSAGLQDRVAAKQVFRRCRQRFPRLRLVWADGGYAGTLSAWVAGVLGWTLTIVKRAANTVGFVLLAKRWIVERTLAWFNRYRRLSKDYEELTRSSEAMIQLAMIRLLLKRLANT